MKRLYLAYGSNLNVEQMKYRCPTAKIYGKGMLHGFRLLFKGGKENAYLTIEPFKGGKVPVVIWNIKPKDEIALDRYEGYPSFYYKDEIEVELETGEVVIAMVYIMTKERVRLNLPSRNYLAVVKEGYKEHGFGMGFLNDALKVSKGSGFNG